MRTIVRVNLTKMKRLLNAGFTCGCGWIELSRGFALIYYILGERIKENRREDREVVVCL